MKLIIVPLSVKRRMCEPRAAATRPSLPAARRRVREVGLLDRLEWRARLELFDAAGQSRRAGGVRRTQTCRIRVVRRSASRRPSEAAQTSDERRLTITSSDSSSGRGARA